MEVLRFIDYKKADYVVEGDSKYSQHFIEARFSETIEKYPDMVYKVDFKEDEFIRIEFSCVVNIWIDLVYETFLVDVYPKGDDVSFELLTINEQGWQGY